MIFLLPSIGEAKEHWKAYNEEALWGAPISVATFQGQIYLAAQEKGNTNTKLWTTKDGKAWVESPSPSSGIKNLVTHKNALYIVSVEQIAFDTASFRILQSTDGLKWNVAYQQNTHASSLNHNWDLISFGDYLYMGDKKATGDTLPFSWDRIPNISLYLFSFKNQLYTIRLGTTIFGFNEPWEIILQRVDSNDGSITQVARWEIGVFNAFEFSPIPFAVGVEETGYIYVGANKLWKLDTKTVPYQATLVSHFPIESAYRPTLISDQLHILGNSTPVTVLSPEGNWETVSPQVLTSNNIFRHNEISELDNMTFVAADQLWVLRDGVNEMTLLSSSRSTFLPGEESRSVLGFGITSNGSDTLNTMTVKNFGSALAQQDIRALRLVQKGTNETVGTFSESGNPAERVWALDAAVLVQDGDQFELMVDIASNPTDQASFHFSVQKEGLSFGTNSLFSLDRSLINENQQTISLVPSAAIDLVNDVTIFPVPAIDTVRFRYDLSAGGNVEIQIFNQNGREVQVLKESNKTPDAQATTEWNASGIAPGFYHALIKIQPNGESARQFKKTVLIDRR